MDIVHIGEVVIGGLVSAGIAWGTLRAELRFLRRWTDRHETHDDERFSAVNERIDNLAFRRK